MKTLYHHCLGSLRRFCLGRLTHRLFALIDSFVGRDYVSPEDRPPVPPPIPAVGSRWRKPEGEGNPWRDQSIYATVLETKAGWVRLELGDGSTYEMELERFASWFVPAPNAGAKR